MIIGLIIILMAANTLLLEPYYLNQQKQSMISDYEIISQLEFTRESDFEEVLNYYESSKNLEILIVDSKGTTLFASNNFDADPRAHNFDGKREGFEPKEEIDLKEDIDLNEDHPPVPILVNADELETISVETISENLVYRHVNLTKFNIENLILTGSTEGGYEIELRMSAQSMKSNISITNQFLMIIGTVIFIIAMISAYLLSELFTKPIRSINYTTRQLELLNFDAYCDVNSQDELGELSDNINKMATALSDKINDLKIIDEKRRTLLNNVSHELKTPLTLMQGYAVGLQNNIVNDPEKVDFYCHVIIDESVKMGVLVDTLLDIDKLEYSNSIPQLMVFNINDFIKENYKKFDAQLNDLDHSLSLLDQDIVEVTGDPFMLERVFKNYMTNAIQYVDENQVLSVQLINKGKSIGIEVFNTAPALAEHELSNLWESFYKVDESRNRDKGGHGLGLSIVKAIQNAHNQEYGVQNEENGLCFWFDVEKA